MTNETMPSKVNGGRNIFDRLADTVARTTARARFFAACICLIVVWLPSILFVGSVDTWQLMINTPTTVVTFLLVGLMQNTTARATAATDQKLNALALGHLALLESLGYGDEREADELRAAIGIEHQESA